VECYINSFKLVQLFIIAFRVFLISIGYFGILGQTILSRPSILVLSCTEGLACRVRATFCAAFCSDS
jgi:hypothetical protein